MWPPPSRLFLCLLLMGTAALLVHGDAAQENVVDQTANQQSQVAADGSQGEKVTEKKVVTEVVEGGEESGSAKSSAAVASSSAQSSSSSASASGQNVSSSKGGSQARDSLDVAQVQTVVHVKTDDQAASSGTLQNQANLASTQEEWLRKNEEYRKELLKLADPGFLDTKHGRIILRKQGDYFPACSDFLPEGACKVLKPMCQVSDTARAIRYLRERSDYILYLTQDIQKHVEYVKSTVPKDNLASQTYAATLLKNLENIRNLLPSVTKTAPLIRLILDEDSEEELERILDAHMRFKRECEMHQKMCYQTQVPAYRRHKACKLYDDVCCCDGYKFERYYQTLVKAEGRKECKEARSMRKATRRLIEASCAHSCETCPTRFRAKEYSQDLIRAFDCDHLKVPRGQDLHIHFQPHPHESTHDVMHLERISNYADGTEAVRPPPFGWDQVPVPPGYTPETAQTPPPPGVNPGPANLDEFFKQQQQQGKFGGSDVNMVQNLASQMSQQQFQQHQISQQQSAQLFGGFGDDFGGTPGVAARGVQQQRGRGMQARTILSAESDDANLESLE